MGRASQVVSQLTLAGLVLAACPIPAGAELVDLAPVADTTLIEIAPANNMGAHPFFNAGTTMVNTRNRGLLRFDLSSIPQGSQILDAELLLEVVGVPIGGGANSSFALHRVLKPWGEGSKTGTTGSPGLGSVATQDEATWTHRFAFSTNTWAIPGGSLGEDFVASTTTSTFIEDDTCYSFSGDTLRDDLILWLTDPAQNHGWMLRTLRETTTLTARRFGSREDLSTGPRLRIEFTPPPCLCLTIPSVVSSNGVKVAFSFTAPQPGVYEVQFKNQLDHTPWSALDSFDVQAAPATVEVVDTPAVASRFYQVVRVQ